MRAARGRLGFLIGVGLVVAWSLIGAAPGAAVESEAPAGRAATAAPTRDTLAAREMILVNQVGFAHGITRWRARELYRLLQSPVPEDGQPLPPVDRARVLKAALAGLGRDRREERVLSDELTQVRADRATSAQARPVVAAHQQQAAPPEGATAVVPLTFLAPVEGAQEAGFGPVRESASGVWLFRSDVRFRARASESVRAPEAGVVRRVAETTPRAGSFAVVLQHPAGWTSIIGGLGQVTVAVGQAVSRGQSLGVSPSGARERATVTLELWHQRASVDPATVLRR
jgi:murein DD-endopeptidase MepM/ murein hydrolase activator NlpD